MSPAKRLDLVLVEEGHVETRPKAQALIMAGKVLVNDEKITKPGKLVAPDSEIRLLDKGHPYVSRGGLKLAGALEKFKIEVDGWIALDAGASTGGFTDVLLQSGAQKVYAIDVGQNQLNWKIRSDERVVVHEGVNIRHLEPDLITDPLDLITIDVSFISVLKLLPALIQVASDKTLWIVLIKPQFEAGPEKIGKNGIVRDASVREDVIKTIRDGFQNHGLEPVDLIESPIKGTKGNVEYLLLAKSA